MRSIINSLLDSFDRESDTSTQTVQFEFRRRGYEGYLGIIG
jgi:hypothetical protein